MNIIDHLSIGVPSISEGTAFYSAIMKTLGNNLLVATESFAAYGIESPQFLLMTPYDGKSPSSGNGTHIAFIANSKDKVSDFHSVACANGGVCEGQPGTRPGYPKEGVYAAFVRDPFGNKLEVIFNGFAA